ncbi:bifunctional riboflavin kinase/FAD synthetase [soil metagenome]
MHFTRISEDAALLAPDAPASVVVIGNFDGVHRGHVGVLGDAHAVAAERSLAVRVLTFDPHPATVMGRVAPATLTTLTRKSELLGGAGADGVFVRTFDRAFSESTPEKFARALLAETLAARVVVVGENFRFGHKRAGDFATLRALGETLGFETLAAGLRGDAGGPFSSTRVRAALAAGDLAEVFAVLGRPHAFSGIVVEGAKRGRTLGCPTANVDRIEEAIPPNGVYAVRVDELDAREHATAIGGGVMNIGVRPTVDGMGKRSQEVNVFDFDRDLYGARLRVHVVARLRGEQKFSGIDALRTQIAMDAANARAALV